MNTSIWVRRQTGAGHAIPVNRRTLLIAAGVVVITLLLRTANLLSLPIFTDEATYLRWSADVFDQKTLISLFIPVMEDGKQPMFIWLATGAMHIFSDPLLAGRAVSVVAGLVSVVGIMVAGHWLEDPVLGLLAGALYAVVPYTLFFDRMALADSQVSMAAIWVFGFGVFIATRATTLRTVVLAGVTVGSVAAFGVWVKSTALFILPFPLLCVVLLSPSLRRWRLYAWGLVAAYGTFVVLAAGLVAMPYSENQLRLLATHVYSPEELEGALPVPVWVSNLNSLWPWVAGFLPAPLCWLALAAAAWGLVRRRRRTLLLIGCWLVVVGPSVLLAHYFMSRYVLASIFPLLFLIAMLAKDVANWMLRARTGSAHPRTRSWAAAGAIGALAILVIAPSLFFDYRLLTAPSTAPWPASDRKEYVEGWSSGFGFNEGLNLALKRASEYGGEVFILSDHFQGLAFDGLALYVRRIPGVRHYPDAQIIWGDKHIIDSWRPHGVPLIIVRNDGRFKPEHFEDRLPEAKRIGIFWKPGGVNSFRVYELDPRALDAAK